MRITLSDLDLRLRRTFRISRAALDVASNVLVALGHRGLTGLGECHPSDYYGEDRPLVRRALEVLGGWLAGQPDVAPPFDAIGDLLDALPPEVKAVRGALAAFDIALHDLVGQLAGKPLWELFGIEHPAAPVTSYTIGIAPLADMQDHVREAERYPILKIKLGTDRDAETLEAIRAVTDRTLRVDANAAWSVEQAIERIRALEPYGIEFVEQPIPPGDIAGLRRIRAAVSLPIFVDESVTTSADIPALAGAVDGINIKLGKSGGLREARRMIQLARSLGLKIMLGCYVESSVAITAAAHLSPLADYADLDGNLLIANDPYEGVTVDAAGHLVLPDRPGLGLRPREG